MKPISKIAKGVAPSATLSIDQLAKNMKAEGLDVVAFGAGEPDFNTPDFIKEAGIAAINANKTRYTPSEGIIELRKAVCAMLKNDLGLDYKPNQISVTSGAKHNVFIALQAICNPGDEVILPAPYWVTYEESIKMAAAVPVVVETNEETRFKITPDMLEKAITPKTKCLILTNPSNPTGMVYTKDELAAIAKVVVERDIYVMSDEIYNALTYTCDFISFASFGDEVKERTILINGVSKTYAMTGWRIGYAAANDEISAAMANYLSHSTGSASTISQWASVNALEGSQDEVFSMKAEFDKRRKYFADRVNSIDGVSCLEPDGAFYIFMNIKKLLGRSFYGDTVNTSPEFAAALLKHGLVAVVPGNAFGADGYLRWSYATSMENIKKGLDRLEKFLREE